MIIKAKSYFATAFFMDVREIVGSSPAMTVFYLPFPNFPLSFVILGHIFSSVIP
jgi:hypothetical protein